MKSFVEFITEEKDLLNDSEKRALKLLIAQVKNAESPESEVYAPSGVSVSTMKNLAKKGFLRVGKPQENKHYKKTNFGRSNSSTDIYYDVPYFLNVDFIRKNADRLKAEDK